MRVLLILALSLAVASAIPTKPTGQRIVGGSVTTISEYPFGALLLFSWTGSGNFAQDCGASIINNRAILSAAHCYYGYDAYHFRIRVGSTYANSGGSVHPVTFIINHPNYDDYTTDNDVSILHTSIPFSFTNEIRVGQIAGLNYNVADNQVVWAIGWGSISSGGPLSEQLRHVQVWTVNQDVCRSRYAELGLLITDNMLCSGWLDVGGRDQCQGDSGGPLLHNNVIVGVCSWGLGCALARYPGVNARVSRYTSWIQANA